MIADTCFIIDLLKNQEDAEEKIEELEKKNREYSISTPTIYELFVGVSRSSAEQKSEIPKIITSQAVHPLDCEASRKAGEIQKELIENGEQIGHLDALISGTAASNGEKILTRNEKEFVRAGIELESY